MIEPVVYDKEDSRIVSMGDMEPLDIGVVVSGCKRGILVMRTALCSKFEIMNLSNPRQDGCWTWEGLQKAPDLKVQLLPAGESITITVK